MLPHLVIAGLPGAGKSSVARCVATTFPRGVHLEVDQLRAMVATGRTTAAEAEGWSDALAAQFQQEIEAATKLAATFRTQGYAVVIDDVAIPPVFPSCYGDVEGLQRVLLLPSVETLSSRLRERQDLYDDVFISNAPMLHAYLSETNKDGWLVIDNSDMDAETAAQRVLAAIA